MGCCDGFAKFLLVIFNGIFVVCGAGLIGVATWLKVDPNAWNYLHVAAYQQDQLFHVSLWIMIGLGLFVLLVAGFGFFGACTSNSCMLLTYAVLLGLILVGQLAIGITAVVFRNKIEGYLKEHMINQIKEEYKEAIGDSRNVLTAAWDWMQVKLKCCGVNGPYDYQGSQLKNSSIVPFTCCELQKDDPNDPQPKNETACDLQARANITENTEYFHGKGCYEGLLDWVKQKSVILIGIGFGLIAVEVLGIVFACCLRNQEKEKIR